MLCLLPVLLASAGAASGPPGGGGMCLHTSVRPGVVPFDTRSRPAAKTDDVAARGETSDRKLAVGGAPWPKKVLSWWYAANTEANWKLLLKQVDQPARLPLVTSIQVRRPAAFLCCA